MTKSRTLPRWMHLKHGRYYIVRENKWTPLARDLHDALVEYAQLTATTNRGEMAELVNRALEDMRLTVADSTYKNYSVCAKRVKRSFAKFTPRQVRPVHVAEFLDHHKKKPSMANLLHSFLKGMFQRAVRWGIVEANPVRDIQQFATKRRDRYITADEYQKILAKAPETLQCLMEIAYITGQRIGDVMNIRYSDITEAGLFVRQQKTKARVMITMTPDLTAAINKARSIHQSVKGLTLFHKRNGELLAYSTIYGHWQKACKAAGVEDAHFHDIRAASATDAKKQGLDSRKLLGHTTESSHNRYLRDKETPVATPVPARKS
ncbi:tyrosine-type recombinase/integrase [Uliginosibacterium paludis]|uniref:Tyrosine-type recombinase/integrase n=1 Tax=Uliginosibacterium paludis TaxID=1615952 RepID=A0ABV2CUG3_9RHOO